LEKRISTIPNAGFGLFTTVNIPKSFLFAEYTGRVVTDHDLQRRYGHYTAPYAVCVRNSNGSISHHIDAANPAHSSLARYANDARSKRSNNAEFEQHKDRVFLKATRDILANEEILVSYGPYWGNSLAEAEQKLINLLISDYVLGVKTTVAYDEAAVRSAFEHGSVVLSQHTYILNLNDRPVQTLKTVFQLNNPIFLATTTKRASSLCTL